MRLLLGVSAHVANEALESDWTLLGQKFQSTSGDNVAIKVVLASEAHSIACIKRDA